MTAPAASPPAELPRYRCRCCGCTLGHTDGVRLVLSPTCYTTEPTPLRCVCCGARSFWRPVARVDTPPATGYTANK